MNTFRGVEANEVSDFRVSNTVSIVSGFVDRFLFKSMGVNEINKYGIGINEGALQFPLRFLKCQVLVRIRCM